MVGLYPYLEFDKLLVVGFCGWAYSMKYEGVILNFSHSFSLPFCPSYGTDVLRPHVNERGFGKVNVT